jgi:hypothetical protein
MNSFKELVTTLYKSLRRSRKHFPKFLSKYTARNSGKSELNLVKIWTRFNPKQKLKPYGFTSLRRPTVWGCYITFYWLLGQPIQHCIWVYCHSNIFHILTSMFIHFTFPCKFLWVYLCLYPVPAGKLITLKVKRFRSCHTFRSSSCNALYVATLVVSRKPRETDTQRRNIRNDNKSDMHSV